MRTRLLLPKPPKSDPRNRDHPVTATPTRDGKKKIWPCPPPLDQGPTLFCHGYAWAQLLLAAPHPTNATTRQAHALANHLQTQANSTPNAAPGYLLANGIIDEYQWAQDLDQIEAAITTTGPAVLAAPWLNSMMFPNRYGRITYRPDRDPVYHFTLIRGYNPRRRTTYGTREPAYRIRNTWGRDWGHRGDAWISATDLDRLIRSTSYGYESAVCVPIGKHANKIADLLT